MGELCCLRSAEGCADYEGHRRSERENDAGGVRLFVPRE